MNFSIMSLGCRLNMAEIQSVSTALQIAGHKPASREEADLLIINSCCVTGTGDRKTRQLLYQSKRIAENKDVKIILTGCGAGRERSEGNVYYISNDYKYLIPKLVEDWSIFDSIERFASSRFDYVPAERSSRIRINMKIQDGCSNFCSYCIIPFVRGNPVSKPAKAVADELRLLADEGYREFVLTGVCIGDYSYEDVSLSGLLSRLLAIQGDFRIHLSSISPLAVDDELIDLLQHEKMVKHLAMSIQSGSTRILKLMNRPYTSVDYLKKVEALRKKISFFNLTTDIIVGFPKETAADFKETLKLVKEADFSFAHVFRYSPRQGTAASKMEDTVSADEKRERSRRLMELVLEQRLNWYKKFDGGKSCLLSEGKRRGKTKGFNQYYVPMEAEKNLSAGEFFQVQTFFDGKGLKAVLL